MRASSCNHTSTRVPGTCAARTRSNCNPTVAKTPPAPSHRPAGGEDAAPTNSTLSDAAAGRCSTGCINRKLLLQYSLRVDRAKRHYPVPLQLGASDNPLLEPRARHRVYPWLSTRTRPITQSLDAVLFIPVMPFVSR